MEKKRERDTNEATSSMPRGVLIGSIVASTSAHGEQVWSSALEEDERMFQTMRRMAKPRAEKEFASENTQAVAKKTESRMKSIEAADNTRVLLLQRPSKPMIRLETLSSRAAVGILAWIYAVFVLALIIPYFERRGLLAQTFSLPGGVCNESSPTTAAACTIVDESKMRSVWRANLSHVPWFSGSVLIQLNVSGFHPNLAPAMHSRVFVQPNRTTQQLVNLAQVENTFISDGEDNQSESAVNLLYDFKILQLQKEEIIHEFSRTDMSGWLDCTGDNCQLAELVNLSEEVEELAKINFDAYSISITFHGICPNVIADAVEYRFVYTHEFMHLGEVCIRIVLIIMTIAYLLMWRRRINMSKLRDNKEWLPVQEWVFLLGLILIFWENPLQILFECLPLQHHLHLRFASDCCQIIGEVLLYAGLLSVLYCYDDTSKRHRILTAAFVLLFVAVGISMSFVKSLMYGVGGLGARYWKVAFVSLGGILSVLIFVWIAAFTVSVLKIARNLKAEPFMATRFKQLSFRFFVLQSALFCGYMSINQLGQVIRFIKIYHNDGMDAMLKRAASSLIDLHSGYQPLGRLLFLSSWIFFLLYVHLPPIITYTMGSMTSNAYIVHESSKFKLSIADRSLSLRNVFCLETACWLADMSWKAYFDPSGQPSSSGHGEIGILPYGFELVTILRQELIDTHVLIVKDEQRLVISFRGSASRKNWVSNLRAHQETLWINAPKRGKKAAKSCGNCWKRLLSKVPLASQALPRVHSGFWRAYACVRDELLELVSLLQEESPGLDVYVTGHSMGGALAVLAAYDMAINKSIYVTMYNFGAPRVGNPAFVRQYNEKVPHSFRIAMDGDIVPGVPKFWGLYQHVGTEVAIDALGNLIVGPTFVEQYLHAQTKLSTHVHACRIYIDSLSKCLNAMESLPIP